jgi:hypothetical protein
LLITITAGEPGNLGIDRYYLTGKSTNGENISMDITHYPNDNLARINFNNLELDEIEQWFMSLDRSLTTNEYDEQPEKVEEIYT